MTTPSVQMAPPQMSQQLVAITSVDVVGQTAQGLTRQGSTVSIDTRYFVGGIHVTPATGQQWVLKKVGMSWALDRQLPYNTASAVTVADNPVEGQVQIGSSGAATGPLQLFGSLISANGPLGLQAFSTDELPDAGTAGAGALVWDSTTGEIKFSDGTVWNSITTSGSSSGGSTSTSAVGEIPTGSLNGTNPIFVVSQNFVMGTTAVYVNGLREQLNVDYTENSPQIIFATPPLAGDEISVDYIVT